MIDQDNFTPFARADRHFFDVEFCRADQGFALIVVPGLQCGTGYWCDPVRRLIVRARDGLIEYRHCPDDESFRADLIALAKFFEDRGNGPICIVSDPPEIGQRLVELGAGHLVTGGDDGRETLQIEDIPNLRRHMGPGYW